MRGHDDDEGILARSKGILVDEDFCGRENG